MENVNLKPLADRVVVQPLESEDVTAGGIVLPDTAKEKPQKGKILAVGPGIKDDAGNVVPMEVEVDDVVLFAKYAGTELELEEDLEVLILRESDILAVIEE